MLYDSYDYIVNLAQICSEQKNLSKYSVILCDGMCWLQFMTFCIYWL